MRKRKSTRRVIIEIKPSDPLSWDNPANEDAWRELARAIGRKIADDQARGLIGPIKGQNDHDDEK